MRFDIITIFPRFFASFVKEALIARAQKKQLIEIRAHNLRKWTTDLHQSVDDRPYGGGAGMVMRVDVIARAIDGLRKSELRTQKSDRRARIILLTPKGKVFNQKIARRFAKYDQLIMICGRYEGVDERVATYIADEEISIGDYVLFGGEVPAMAVIEAVTRLLPGAVGKKESVAEESFSKNFLEYPHYTRPEVIKIRGKPRRVPKILLSGDHKKIEAWRQQQSYKITKQRRPDLLT